MIVSCDAQHHGQQQKDKIGLRKLTGETPLPPDENDLADVPDEPVPDGPVPENPIEPVPENPIEITMGPDTCAEAEAVSVGDMIQASNIGSSLDIAVPCESFYGDGLNGVWYMIEGTGSGIQVYVNATFDIQVGLFKGTCDELVCEDGTAGDAFPFTDGDLKFASDVGEMYYINVAGVGNTEGTFSMEIIEGETPANAACSDAQSIEIGEVVMGTTDFGATPVDIPPCSL